MMPSPQARPLFLLAALFAPLGVAAPKALVPLLIIIALWLLWRRWRQGQLRRPFQGTAALPVLVPAAVLAAWALLSAWWALDPAAACWTFTRLAGVMGAALILFDGRKDLSPSDSPPLRRALLGTFAFAALLLGAENLSGTAAHLWWYEALGTPKDFNPTVLNRAEILLLLAAGPCAMALWQWRPRAGALSAVAVLAVAAAVIMLGVSNSNKAALALGLGGAALAWWTGPWLQRLLAGLLAAGVLAAPLLPATLLAPDRLSGYFDKQHYSGLHRLYIWEFTAQRIAEAPVLGWGLDAARRIPGGDTILPQGGLLMSLHPHNASLQIWLELGALGALFWALLLAGLWLGAAGLGRRDARAAATGLLLAGLVVAHLSFGIWQTWWLAALVLGGVIFALALRLRPAD